MDLDLTKAIDAAREEVWNLHGSSKPITFGGLTADECRDAAGAAVRAAVAPLLAALADQAEADKAAAREKHRTAPTATERVTALQWADACELSAIWLRAKAEEARRG